MGLSPSLQSDNDVSGGGYCDLASPDAAVPHHNHHHLTSCRRINQSLILPSSDCRKL